MHTVLRYFLKYQYFPINYRIVSIFWIKNTISNIDTFSKLCIPTGRRLPKQLAVIGPSGLQRHIPTDRSQAAMEIDPVTPPAEQEVEMQTPEPEVELKTHEHSQQFSISRTEHLAEYRYTRFNDEIRSKVECTLCNSL